MPAAAGKPGRRCADGIARLRLESGPPRLSKFRLCRRYGAAAIAGIIAPALVALRLACAGEIARIVRSAACQDHQKRRNENEKTRHERILQCSMTDPPRKGCENSTAPINPASRPRMRSSRDRYGRASEAHHCRHIARSPTSKARAKRGASQSVDSRMRSRSSCRSWISRGVSLARDTALAT
jgi:hypothetical protein